MTFGKETQLFLAYLCGLQSDSRKGLVATPIVGIVGARRRYRPGRRFAHVWRRNLLLFEKTW